MHIQYKETPVTGVSVVDDKKGIIEALVSVTGIVDNVKDIIEPGSYKVTLGSRRPKGVWHHSWTEPIAKTKAATEIYPGDPSLPKTLPNGQPWPSEAGALKIRMQFNLNTPRGKTAYEDVKFFGAEQEWSIGYNVPPGGAKKGADGIRRIKQLELYEYSPVLFGAMPHARTVEGVKEAQLAYKSLLGIDTKEIEARLVEYVKTIGDIEVKDDPAANIAFLKDDPDDDGEDSALDPDDTKDEDLYDDEDDFEFEAPDPDGDDEPTKSIKPATLRKAIDALNELLAEVDGDEDEGDAEKGFLVYVEAKAVEYSTLVEAVDAMTVPEAVVEPLGKAAGVFDAAVKDGDKGKAETAAASVMDVLEDTDDSDDADVKDGLAVIARVMTDLMEKMAGAEESVEESKADSYAYFNYEYKMVTCGSRVYGWPRCIDGAVVSRKQQVEAFVAGLKDDALADLDYYLSGVTGERAMKRLVLAENQVRSTGTKRAITPKPQEKKTGIPIAELKALGVSLDGIASK